MVEWMTDITAEIARRLLRYDTASGELFWKVAPCRRMKAGDRAGSPDRHGYIAVRINHKSYRAHRLAWLIHYGVLPDKEVDHIDGDRRNNSIANLRCVDSTENHKNYAVTDRNKSGCVGVSFDTDRSSWVSRITTHKKTIWLGYYHSFFDAVCSRKSAEITYGFHENHGRPCQSGGAK